jgi:hypothetical protein
MSKSNFFDSLNSKTSEISKSGFELKMPPSIPNSAEKSAFEEGMTPEAIFLNRRQGI